MKKIRGWLRAFWSLRNTFNYPPPTQKQWVIATAVVLVLVLVMVVGLSALDRVAGREREACEKAGGEYLRLSRDPALCLKPGSIIEVPRS